MSRRLQKTVGGKAKFLRFALSSDYGSVSEFDSVTVFGYPYSKEKGKP